MFSIGKKNLFSYEALYGYVFLIQEISKSLCTKRRLQSISYKQNEFFSADKRRMIVLFDNNKKTMARKPGKVSKENPVWFSGKV